MTVSPSATAEARVTLTVAPLMVTAALAPSMVLAVPPSGVAVTVNAVPADAESAFRLLPNVTFSAVPFTVALRTAKAGSRLPSTLWFGPAASLARFLVSAPWPPEPLSEAPLATRICPMKAVFPVVATPSSSVSAACTV